MDHVPHELLEEFPDAAEKISALKTRDGGFARLADNYHSLNREIYMAETNVAPTDDFHLEDMKKQRLAMLDEIVRRLQTA